MDRRTKILLDEFNPEVENVRTCDADLKLSITLNPDVDKIKNAMDENGHQMCLDLLEYMAKNKVQCKPGLTEPLLYYKGEWITKDKLFENFL